MVFCTSEEYEQLRKQTSRVEKCLKSMNLDGKVASSNPELRTVFCDVRTTHDLRHWKRMKIWGGRGLKETVNTKWQEGKAHRRNSFAKVIIQYSGWVLQVDEKLEWQTTIKFERSMNEATNQTAADAPKARSFSKNNTLLKARFSLALTKMQSCNHVTFEALRVH